MHSHEPQEKYGQKSFNPTSPLIEILPDECYSKFQLQGPLRMMQHLSLCWRPEDKISGHGGYPPTVVPAAWN